jgi:hypothetical protein
MPFSVLPPQEAFSEIADFGHDEGAFGAGVRAERAETD